ncbi:MAG: class I SAM-dependent rRNA methyltransferase, partial [Anaerolineaceae bacterium]
MADIILKSGREKSVRQHHPWLFSGSIDHCIGNPAIGETVRVISAHGEQLGWAAYSPASQIRARMWSFNPDDVIDTSFIRQRLEKAIQLRRNYAENKQTNAYRLVHGESDGFPGLIVDRYGGYLVTQFLSAGVEYHRDLIIDLLVKLSGIPNIYERSDLDVRILEGLVERTGLLAGSSPPDRLIILENGRQFLVDLLHGQKTGFYLDQRDNRKIIGAYAQGTKILNCFCYTGGFSVYALTAGASFISNIDSSSDALNLAKENIRLNNLPLDKTAWIEGDVFQELRKLRDQAESFDVIILDPPKFAATSSQVERAARGYKDINLLAFKLLRPGGVLFTFSCSGGISPELFQKIVAGAALDADVDALILEKLGQASDHPIALNFP